MRYLRVRHVFFGDGAFVVTAFDVLGTILFIGAFHSTGRRSPLPCGFGQPFS
jgi:hypothetical protein